MLGIQSMVVEDVFRLLEEQNDEELQARAAGTPCSIATSARGDAIAAILLITLRSITARQICSLAHTVHVAYGKYVLK